MFRIARRALCATTVLFFVCETTPAHAVDYNALAPSAAPNPLQLVISPLRRPTSIMEVGSSVTLITQQEIEEKNADHVADLLRDVPGTTVTSTGGPGQTQRVLLRGGESRHTLVMVDGMVVNDPSDVGNAFDFAYLTSDNIESIEVLRGPQSTLYGSDAIGGVINITTKSGRGKPKNYASFEGGSYQTYKGAAGSHGQVGRMSYSVDASRFDTRGISAFNQLRGGSERDPYSNNNLSTRLGAQVTDNFALNLALRATDASVQFDNFGADSKNIAKTSQRNGRAAGVLHLFNRRWRQELGVGNLEIKRHSVNDFGNNIYNGQRQTMDWQHNFQLADSHMLTGGVVGTHEEFRSEITAAKDADTRAAYGQYDFNINQQLFLSAGGRVDRHDTFGSETTWRVAPSWRIASTGTRLKASVGTGFKAPSLFQLFSDFGNAALQPETSKGYDAGVEQLFFSGKVTAGSTWFTNTIDDLVDFDFATNKYNNVGKVKTRGLENFISFIPIDALTLTLNHTYLLAEDTTTHLELIRRPRHQASFTADYRFGQDGNVMLMVNHTGRRADNDLAFTRTHLPPHGVVNLAANWHINETFTLYGRVDNLFNKEYEDVFGFGTAGMSAYTGIRGEF